MLSLDNEKNSVPFVVGVDTNLDIDENYSPTFKGNIQRSTFSPVPF